MKKKQSRENNERKNRRRQIDGKCTRCSIGLTTKGEQLVMLQ